MGLFTSVREKRLWFGALAVVAAIYSTLGLAGRLADVLGERTLLGVSFAAGFVAVIAAAIGIGLTGRPRRQEIWVAVGIIAVFAMVIVRMGVGPVERTHLFEYGLLAILLHEALVERRHNGRHVPVPAIIALLATALLGWIDEGIQAFVPGRVYDTRDLLVNSLAAVMGVTVSLILGGLRRRLP